MPTLNAPQSATYVTASPQEFVNVICTGATDVMLVSWVGPAGTSGQRTVRNTTSAGEDIGPLLDGTTVTFLAQAGAPVYSAPAFSPPVQSLVSGAGIPTNVDLNGYNLIGLRKIIAKAAGGAVGGGRSRILFVGTDSTFTGAGAGTSAGLLTNARRYSVPTLLAQALTAAGIPTYNDAVMGTNNVVSSGGSTYPVYDPRTSIAAGWVVTNTGQIGREGWVCTSAAQTWSLTPAMTFDSIDIIYTTVNGTGGTVTVNVDGGATLDTIVSTSAAPATQLVRTIAVPRGTHTINIVSSNTNSFTLNGVIPTDTTVGGIDIINGSHHGGSIAAFASVAAPQSPSSALALSNLAPSLIICCPTINDSNNATAIGAYTSNLAIAGAAWAAAADLIYMTGLPSNTAATTNGTLAAVVAALRAQAASQSKLCMNQVGRWNNVGVNTTVPGWLADGIHGIKDCYADQAAWMANLFKAAANA